ncbi:WD repeat-containing protein pop2 [Hondaea fermentalgiana]|uniref:WD repeat-containing protein pop2 n=1 Tax=Hondaea fermentalgiana TaxID=2315210 RepID=A0A2R5GAA4_9STRA|nr:WD repeat-containing protein pop2 [Hondaea fermentalgiana]|eukprot:GBG26668.1 WD repeat-containing protein pop2 [Hondaea fermentalgiana]
MDPSSNFGKSDKVNFRFMLSTVALLGIVLLCIFGSARFLKVSDIDALMFQGKQQIERSPLRGVHGGSENSKAQNAPLMPRDSTSDLPRECNMPLHIMKKDHANGPIALASYPGSGNTWTRHVIQQGSRLYTGSMYNDRKLYKGGFLAEMLRDRTVVAVKTHYPCKNCWKKGKNSYVPTEGSKDDVQEAFEDPVWQDFIWAKGEGWANHTGFWLSEKEDITGKRWKDERGRPVRLFYFEDLVNNFEREVLQLLQHLRDIQGEDSMPAPEIGLQCVMHERDGGFKRKPEKIFNPYTAEQVEYICKPQSLAALVRVALPAVAAAAAAMGRIEGYVWSVAQTADLVLAASGDDRCLRAWSKKDGALVLEMKTPDNREANAVAVQGKLAALGTVEGGLFLIDLATASVLHALQGHTGFVNSVIFDGDEIISGGGSGDQTVRVWDKISGRETMRIDAEAEVNSVAAHENLLVAGLGDNTVRVFDRASGGPRHVLKEAAGKVYAVATDTQRMVSGSWDYKVRVYVMPSFHLVRFMRGVMLLSNCDFPEDAFTSGRQGEPLYLVSSLLKNSTDADLDAEIADMDPGLTCVLDFSEFFLPDGVFARLLSLCAQHSGDHGALARAPRLAGNKAIIFFGLSVFALEQTQDKIWIRVERDSKKPATTLKTLVSMFRGARDAVFRDLPWGLLLQSPRNASILVSYDDVVRARTSGVDSVLSVSTKVVNVGDFEPFFKDGSLKEDEHDTGHVERAPVRQPGAGLEYHVFLSHRQVDAGDTCNLIAEKLQNRGLKVWFDQESQGNLAEDAMRRGIRASKCYLLFLSKTVFEGAVRMELETALQEEKPILLVHESDPNRVGFDTFSSYIESAPDAAKHLFRETESMPFQRRLYLAEAFYEEFIARIDAI